MNVEAEVMALRREMIALSNMVRRPHSLTHEISGGDEVRLHVRAAGVDTTGRYRSLNVLTPLTVVEDATNQEYEIGLATSALDFGEVGDITSIDPGDAAVAGATGEVADAAHQHAWGGMSPITDSLAGNVSLNNVANFFTGPTIAQGTSGTWFVSGTVTVIDTAGAAQFYAKLWDGTTIIAQTEFYIETANKRGPMALSGYIASPAGNLRISVQDITSASGLIAAALNDGNGKASTISAIRIA